ncbi:copper amine oxidase [Cohnella sp. CFH 77786]|uniref:stalk domain-containing protein n=1 Tax=Cohnella sp. CFH 77786 TaxID=2662265 RepID=UPI001C610C90|nr:stalk domain-containing protein [Cohnella sp. CFH 77786]MBW5448074.1 copper amine oxidase [Cohnella sp. CFH 77786]
MNKWGKTFAAALIACGAFTAVNKGDAVAADKPVTVLLDDVAMTFDGTQAQIRSNLTFVPFRPIAEALGIAIKWNAADKRITAQAQVGGQSKTVILNVGKTRATVNGQSVQLAAAPYTINGFTLIPLNFFSTQFGAKVGWEPASRTVSIVSPARAMHVRGFYAISSFPERDRIADMNSVAFGWARLDGNGELTTSGKDFYWPPAAGETTPESIVSGASAQGIEPYLMVFAVDGKDELTKMLSDPSLRDRSIDKIVALVQEKGFSGVMLDYEGLGLKAETRDRQKKLLNEYVRLLADRLNSGGIKLSLAVPPPNSAYKAYDYATLAGIADDLVVMAYEYHPAGTPDHVPQPNAWVNAAIVTLLKAGVPKEKLLLGIDLWSETPQSIDGKLGLAKRYALKGTAFWRIGLYSYYGKEMTDAIHRAAVKLPK